MVKICFIHLRNSYKSRKVSQISISCVNFSFSSINSKWARTQVTQDILLMTWYSQRLPGCCWTWSKEPQASFSNLNVRERETDTLSPVPRRHSSCSLEATVECARKVEEESSSLDGRLQTFKDEGEERSLWGGGIPRLYPLQGAM